MVLPGHIAGGYLATKIILALSQVSFSPTQTVILLTIGALIGEGPDIDLIYFYLENRRLRNRGTDNHRDYITHAPLFWLISSTIIFIAGTIAGSIFVSFIGLVILVGSWSHFILDSIEGGISWFRPFSKKKFCLRQTQERKFSGQKGTISHYWKIICDYYFNSWTFYAEIMIVIIAIVVFISFR